MLVTLSYPVVCVWPLDTQSKFLEGSYTSHALYPPPCINSQSKFLEGSYTSQHQDCHMYQSCPLDATKSIRYIVLICEGLDIRLTVTSVGF